MVFQPRSSALAILPYVVPFAVIAIMRLVTQTAWAASSPKLAAGLFAWIVADALLLALIAKAPAHRPSLFSVVAMLSLACLVIIAGAAAPVRAVYLDLPQVMIAAAATVSIFAMWSGFRLLRAYRRTGSAERALEQVVPEPLAGLIMSECRMLWLALARWNAPVDVPQGARAFAYHTYLVPMIVTFIVLQVIEIGVVHLLLMMWSPTAAWVLFALSVWGLMWMTALLKSFRLYPVLLQADTVRIRSGMIHDFTIDRANIACLDRPLSSAELKHKRVLNLALMSAPNVSIRLNTPVAIPTFWGGQRKLNAIGLRLDNAAEFVRVLNETA